MIQEYSSNHHRNMDGTPVAGESRTSGTYIAWGLTNPETALTMVWDRLKFISDGVDDPQYVNAITSVEIAIRALVDSAALAAWNTGKTEQAVAYGEEAVRLSPNDSRLKENLRWYKGLNTSKTLHELGTTTDKSWPHGYLHLYQALFEPIRRTAQTVLEIGIHTGDSIRMWRDYFINAHVYGIDVVDNCGGLVGEDRITAMFRDAYTKETVDSFGETRFDVIVEDGAHTLESMRFAVREYSKLLTTTGILVIEDIPDPTWIQTLAADTPSELRPYIYGVDRRIALSTPSYFNDESMFVIDKRFIYTEANHGK